MTGWFVLIAALLAAIGSYLVAQRDIQKRLPSLVEFLRTFEHLLSKPAYVRSSEFEEWHTEATTAYTELPALTKLSFLRPFFAYPVARFTDAVRSGREQISTRNAQYVEQRINDPVFDNMLDSPFTKQQREAILHDEDAVLVVAGAGTGKTSALVGKVGYLIGTGAAEPSQILVLSFLKKVGQELRRRIDGLAYAGISNVCVHNIHQYANSIIGQVEGKKRSVTNLADSKRARVEFIQGVLDDLLEGLESSGVLRFLLFDLPSPFYFGSGKSKDYWTEWRNIQHRSLSGDYVKSREEMMIADFLFAMGVNFEYERPYEVKLHTPERREYRPDFFLPEKKIYIEHFGLDTNDEPPPFLTEKECGRYKDDCRWKQKTHIRCGTKHRLIETYSRDASAGVLLSNLEQQLRDHGVEMSPPSASELRTHPSVEPRLSHLSCLMARFLELYKAGHWTAEGFIRRASEHRQAVRAQRFLAFFEKVLSTYEKRLRKKDEIDFTDMLDIAGEYVASGKFTTVYRYVLVDEFQDIDAGSVRFLRALLGQESRPRLFCIGDDWQSIFRFRGGDLGYMRDYGSHFGFCKQLEMTETFRFDDSLEVVSSRFIQRNPAQMPKQLVCKRRGEELAIRVLLVPKGPDGKPAYDEGVKRSLHIISEQDKVENPSVLILGRYRRLKKRISIPWDVASLQGGTQAEFSTIHGSKGLEKDYVIAVGLESGLSLLNFPSSFSDDPLLDMLLACPEAYPHAEERRLFYVAMTRARYGVFLVAPEKGLSIFVHELERDRYNVEWVDSTKSAGLPDCPDCSVGTVCLHKGVQGMPSWWECDLCGARPYWTRCPKCGKGVVQLERRNSPPFASECSVCGDTIDAQLV